MLVVKSLALRSTLKNENWFTITYLLFGVLIRALGPSDRLFRWSPSGVQASTGDSQVVTHTVGST